MAARGDYADVIVTEQRRLRIAFKETVTEEQARAAVLDGTFYDIGDEEELKILWVDSVEFLP